MKAYFFLLLNKAKFPKFLFPYFSVCLFQITYAQHLSNKVQSVAQPNLKQSFSCEEKQP